MSELTEEKVAQHMEEEMQKALEFFKKKNHDYSNSYFSEPHTNADRFANLRRKFFRLKTFYETDKEVKIDETVEDTLKDLAIYSFMEMVRLKHGERNDA